MVTLDLEPLMGNIQIDSQLAAGPEIIPDKSLLTAPVKLNLNLLIMLPPYKVFAFGRSKILVDNISQWVTWAAQSRPKNGWVIKYTVGELTEDITEIVNSPRVINDLNLVSQILPADWEALEMYSGVLI